MQVTEPGADTKPGQRLSPYVLLSALCSAMTLGQVNAVSGHTASNRTDCPSSLLIFDVSV
jgi:hypothetical protein